MAQKVSARSAKKHVSSKTALNKISLNKMNPALVLFIVVLMILAGYLIVRLSFAAGSNVTATNASAKTAPSTGACSGITPYTYLTAYDIYCENGTTANERPLSSNPSSKTQPKPTYYGCQGVTRYTYLTAYGVYCENGTTVNERPGTKG